ncbi:MAG: ROK family protein [Candidatus Woesearchaeota archaeon]
MIVGVDLGGTKIRAGLINKFEVKKEITLLTNAKQGRKKVLKTLFEAIDYVFDNNVEKIGIAVAGSTDGKKVFEATNIKCLNNINLASIISKRYGVKCFLENDANAFALAEYHFIKKKNPKLKNLVGITLGTGVGGGIIINGEIYRGSFFSAGEIGHMSIASNLIKCGCGNYDCFEVYCNGKAIERYYYELTKKRVPSDMIGKEISKDKNALKAIHTYSKYLGIGLVNIANIFSPEYIVIGGGISKLDEIYKPAIKHFKRYALKSVKKTKIIKSRLGDNSIVIGASMLSFSSKKKKKF